MSLQICHCGWSKATTYHGLRTHQGKMGCTPKGMGIPESEQFRFSSYRPQLTYQGPLITVKEPLMNTFTPPFKSGSQQNTWMNQKDSGEFNWTTPVSTENVPVSPYFTTTTLPGTEDEFIEMIKSSMHYNYSFPTVLGNQILDGTNRVLDFAGGAQPSLRPVSQIFSTQVNPAAAEVPGKETNKSAFQTPPHDSTTHQTIGNARRALDFSTSAQQVEQQVWDIPTTTAQETVRPKEREQEKEKEDQKLQQARQDRMRADLQQKIQTREQKMAEVRSSVKACKGGLDVEWLEISNVFSEVMRVVEDTRQQALQPLEKRRKRVKREAQDLVQKLQKEIDKLKMTIDELDKNPDLQVSPQTGLGETCDWKNVTVDTLFSFGTLRTITSNMMEEIHKELDKLSSVELKRIPTFAVDVKLDPTTAHPCLVLSPDGKMVRDGGKTQKVPDAPQRFDMFGSILGLNRLSSGKSYWEVEVANKTGWDLGVARRDATRKGKLSLSPDSGYWAIVHYEEEKYAALTVPPASLSLTGKPQKVGVFVDYEEGLVSFYHVTAKSHIYSFTECSFSDEVFPYFSPHLKQNEKNTHPLIISAVKQQQ
ncbi:E3 ubiquitin-protein ligase TRIM39-like [Anarrhichthys ocellatus]|uniref:E3 ubiquitin-protein ligase TRIM39-like n=1 Tax=Anarrhichthys ocellatus TaxID=433405 RepID=UPI0012EECE0F|nr:E3 ubiquitin-protein ligase TRIM39-like [Anarrhichthys ocellatus]